ncbi:putative acetyltransferase, GNAT family [Talaromyces proteolyticus]|uniref:Acetyltransferase, GNAT family n=1 Tax=Talaromyces proteolyticus TaxID=1131652 RepID=A0AAD4L6G5_9EURO|nr:putative acetyltransferase, GNAT family [Talaromyces proteolyticus]KAH8704809.1 putative acetyltransferase, GNAT family [Talaromyces proteolyticus]
MPGSILENTVDPPLPPPQAHLTSAPFLAPHHDTLKNGARITLYPITGGASSLPPGLLAHLHAEFSAEIERGCTYPMEDVMSLDRFGEYWFGTFAVVALIDEKEDDGTEGIGMRERDWERVCLGTFYIKPNYPAGRCSHICNAGFLTCTAARGLGTGSVMGATYLSYAPKLGYKYSVFNLVFANNPASIRIWERLGFQVIGRVPQAARLRNSEELVDALIYGRALT